MASLVRNAEVSRCGIVWAIALCLAPPYFSQTIFKTTSSQLFLFAASASIILYYALKLKWKITVNLQYFAILILYFIFYLRYLINPYGGVSWFIFFGLVGIIALVLSSSDSSSWIDIFIKFLALLGLFYSLITIITWLIPEVYDQFIVPRFFSDLARSIAGRGYRAGFTSHYSTNAMYIVLGAMSSFSLVLNKAKQRPIFILLLLVEFVALILTTKRAHLAFGVAAIAIAYIMFGYGKKLSTGCKLLIVAAVALLVFYWASYFFPDLALVVERFAEGADDETMNGRAPFYELCIMMWQDSPLFGKGIGSYTQFFNHTPLGLWYCSRGFEFMDAHNVYLQMLAEGGILGFSLFAVALFGSIFRVAKMLARQSAQPNSSFMLASSRSQLTGVLAIQLFFAMYCMTGNPMYDMQMYVPWLLSCAAGALIIRQYSTPACVHN